MQTNVTVALDNITLCCPDIDPAALLALGQMQNDFLERNREIMAEHQMRLMLFGNSSYVINHETGMMELID